MPFQPINFAAIPPQGNSFLRDLVPNLMNAIKGGMQLRQMPEQMERQAQSEELANQLNQLKVNEEPQRFMNAAQAQQFKALLQGAQANRMNKEINSPFYGLPPGDAGQAVAGRILKDRPEFAGAYADYVKNQDLNTANTQSNIAYRDKLVNTLDKARATPLGKSELELNEIKNGLMPGTDGKVKLTPDEQQVLQGQYELKMQKEVSDSDSRKRALFASNGDKTLDQINPKHLTYYSGVAGAAKLAKDQFNSALGKPSEDFMNYQKALTLSNLLAKQVRQFYGDSITPQIQEKLGVLTNPTSWKNDPKVAIENFNTFKDIFKKEKSTYRGALKNTKEFEGKDETIPPPFMKKSVTPSTTSSGGTTPLYKNGKVYDIPNDKLEKALQAGYSKNG